MKKIFVASLLGIMLTLSTFHVLAQSLPFDNSEYAARRARFMEQIPDGIAIIWGSLAGPQNNEIRYLCGTEVPVAVLKIDGATICYVLLSFPIPNGLNKRLF